LPPVLPIVHKKRHNGEICALLQNHYIYTNPPAMKKIALLFNCFLPLLSTAQAASGNKEPQPAGTESASTTQVVRQESFPAPAFKGDLQTYWQQHIRYPADAKEKGVSGTVRLYVHIDRQGQVIDEPIVLKYVSASIDKEAVRVVKEMPAWSPATINGKPVDQWTNVLVPFILSSK
jgi:TonB family protein